MENTKQEALSTLLELLRTLEGSSNLNVTLDVNKLVEQFPEIFNK